MRNFLASLLVLSITLAPRPAHAGMMPSFEASNCAWNATHVVVVSEGARIDGSVQILESWKGDLKPGDCLDVPELAEYESEASRTEDTFWRDDSVTPKRIMSGARMVLFLVKAEKKVAGAAEVVWKPASGWGGMKVSISWVEAGVVYAYAQMINPGDQTLNALESEGSLKKTVDSAIAARAELERAKTIEAPDAKVRALEALTTSEVRDALVGAYQELGKCGDAAIPVLDAHVRKDDHAANAIDALVAVGGDKAAVTFMDILSEELVYWRAKAPTLGENWVNTGDEVQTLRDRYWRLYNAVNALAQMHSPACERVIADTRDLWRSAPELKVCADQIGQLCDATLESLKKPRVKEEKKPEAEEVKIEEEETHTPTLAELSPTVPDDERRVKELVEQLAADLAAEHKLEDRRAVLRGAASKGEVTAELARAIKAALRMSREDTAVLDKLDWQPGSPPWSRELDSIRKRLAPGLASVAPVLSAERVGSAFDIEASWRELAVHSEAVWSGKGQGVDAIAWALTLECLHALAAGEPRRAASFATDLWRFSHDLLRDERLHDIIVYRSWRRMAVALVSEVIPRLDEDGRRVLDGELATLERTLPSFARTVKRRRLAYACFFKETGRLAPSDYGQSALDHLGAQARLSDRRVASLRREWDRFDSMARGIEAAVSSGSFVAQRNHISKLAPEKKRPVTTAEARLHGRYRQSVAHWIEVVEEEHDRHLLEIGCLRALRLLASGTRGVDPYDGSELSVAKRDDGARFVKLAGHVGRSGKDWFVNLPAGK